MTVVNDPSITVAGWRVGQRVKHRLGVFYITAIDGRDAEIQLCASRNADGSGASFKDYAFLFTRIDTIEVQP